MKKVLSSVGIAVLALALIPAAAAAMDKTGAVGIGADSTMGGVSGLSARYQIAKNFGIQAVLGFDTTSYDNTEDGDANVTRDDTQIRAAIRGNIGLAFTKRTNLDLIVGIDVYQGSFAQEGPGDADDDDSHTSFAFELGLGAHYFFTDWFSINGEIGLAFSTVADPADVGRVSNVGTPVAGADGDIEGFELGFGRGDLVGGFGWTFWFN